MADCNQALEPPYEIDCAEYWAELIEGGYYTYPNAPIIVPAGTGTLEARFMTELARRLALAEDHAEKIFYVPLPKSSMPFGTPNYKTDPHNNVLIPSDSETDMMIEGKEYRNNKAIYDFWKTISQKAQNHLLWVRQGDCVWGGEAGFSVTFTASAGIIAGTEMPNQIDWKIRWKGSPMPAKIYIP